MATQKTLVYSVRVRNENSSPLDIAVDHVVLNYGNVKLYVATIYDVDAGKLVGSFATVDRDEAINFAQKVLRSTI